MLLERVEVSNLREPADHDDRYLRTRHLHGPLPQLSRHRLQTVKRQVTPFFSLFFSVSVGPSIAVIGVFETGRWNISLLSEALRNDLSLSLSLSFSLCFFPSLSRSSEEINPHSGPDWQFRRHFRKKLSTFYIVTTFNSNIEINFILISRFTLNMFLYVQYYSSLLVISKLKVL